MPYLMAGSVWRRLIQKISGPRHPEYKEYRDSDDYDPGWEEEERLTPGGSSGLGGGGTDELTAKVVRLKLAAGFVLVISLGASVYLYFVKPSHENIGGLREAASTEVLRHAAMTADGAGKQESIDDIKRWASSMERRAERETDTSAARGGMSGVYGPSNIAPGMPGATPGWTPSSAINSYPYTIDTGRQGAQSSGEYEDIAVDRMSGTSERATSGSPSSPRSVPTTYEPPPVSAPPASANEGVRRDSADRPYQPRRYDPVAIEPRAIEPY